MLNAILMFNEELSEKDISKLISGVDYDIVRSELIKYSERTHNGLYIYKIESDESDIFYRFNSKLDKDTEFVFFGFDVWFNIVLYKAGSIKLPESGLTNNIQYNFVYTDEFSLEKAINDITSFIKNKLDVDANKKVIGRLIKEVFPCDDNQEY